VASEGVDDHALATLLEEHWAWAMASSPEWATSLGDRRFDRQVSDPSTRAADERAAFQAAALDRARSLRAARGSSLSARDATLLSLFIEQLDAEVAVNACHLETWAVSPRINAMSAIFSALDVQQIDGAEALDAYTDRIGAAALAMDAHVDALRAGRAAGRVANRTSLELTRDMIDRQLALADGDWPIAAHAAEGGVTPEQVTARVSAAIAAHLRPALGRYREALDAELIPVARGDDAPGLAGLAVPEPERAACYQALIRRHTTLELTPAELHDTGLRELARIHAEMRVLGARALGVWDRSALFARLRQDPALHFHSGPEILSSAESALRAAEAAVPRAFSTLPQTPCVVAEIPAFEAPYTTIAYYRQPDPVGGKPGEYFVNTFAPETRPTFEARALAFHESVPGHHLQIARSYELPDTPAFLRFEGATAFVEGWALYSERLADELGLYPTDLDRLGMLSFDTWRAARLVVDTGVHHFGWSREQAVRFMLDNTPLAENNVRNEVDRYITWPGQALAYKTGQLEILALRADAQAALGTAFDLAGFHEAILGAGAISLPVLRERVEAWVQATRAR
jgi:uncharacterized protein (DUF885 family)